MDIGLKIKKIREFQNLTQEYVAIQLGISQSSYSRLEKGNTDLQFSRIVKLAGILDVDIFNLLNPDEDLQINIKNYSSGVSNPERHGSKSIKTEYLVKKLTHLEEEIALLHKLL